MNDAKSNADQSAAGLWRFVEGAIGGIPSADPELTERHERLDGALNGEGSDEGPDRVIWNGTYETGDLFTSIQQALDDAESTVPDPPTSDLPNAAAKQSAAKTQSTAKSQGG